MFGFLDHLVLTIGRHGKKNLVEVYVLLVSPTCQYLWFVHIVTRFFHCIVLTLPPLYSVAALLWKPLKHTVAQRLPWLQSDLCMVLGPCVYSALWASQNLLSVSSYSLEIQKQSI